MRATIAAAILLASLTPALGQEKPSKEPLPRPAPSTAPPRAAPAPAPPRDPRPTWAAELPEAPPPGTIGLIARSYDLRPSFCELQVLVRNETGSTIRRAYVHVEVFFGGRSAISDFHVEFVDPGMWRTAIIYLPRGCPQLPTRLVVREVGMCQRPDWQRHGCGAAFVPFMPRRGIGTGLIPIEVAPGNAR